MSERNQSTHNIVGDTWTHLQLFRTIHRLAWTNSVDSGFLHCNSERKANSTHYRKQEPRKIIFLAANLRDWVDFMRRWTFQLICNAFLAVDTFFFLRFVNSLKARLKIATGGVLFFSFNLQLYSKCSWTSFTVAWFDNAIPYSDNQCTCIAAVSLWRLERWRRSRRERARWIGRCTTSTDICGKKKRIKIFSFSKWTSGPVRFDSENT